MKYSGSMRDVYMLLEPQFTIVLNRETEVLECVLHIWVHTSNCWFVHKWGIVRLKICVSDLWLQFARNCLLYWLLKKHNVTYYSHQMRLSRGNLCHIGSEKRPELTTHEYYKGQNSGWVTLNFDHAQIINIWELFPL